MKILKFGGTSIGTSKRIKQVLEIIKNYDIRNVKIAVVFSAFGGVTDQLIELSRKALKRDDSYLGVFQNLRLGHMDVFEELVTHSQKEEVRNHISYHFDELRDILKGVHLLKELTPRIQDNILSYGERLSNYIICEALKSIDIEAEYLKASDLIKTDSTFGNAHVNFPKSNQNIEEHFNLHNKMQIITGFIGSNDHDDITTLGRGGSDFTASIVGAALGAEEIEIWTDVDGILTADPRKVKEAIP